MYYDEAAPPSATLLVIEQAADGKLKGSFYGSPFEVGDYSIRNGVLAFGALTSDASAFGPTVRRQFVRECFPTSMRPSSGQVAASSDTWFTRGGYTRWLENGLRPS